MPCGPKLLSVLFLRFFHDPQKQVLAKTGSLQKFTSLAKLSNKSCCCHLFNPSTDKFPHKMLSFTVKSVFWLSRPWISLNFAEKVTTYRGARCPWRLDAKINNVLLLSMRISQYFCWRDSIFCCPFSFLFPALFTVASFCTSYPFRQP